MTDRELLQEARDKLLELSSAYSHYAPDLMRRIDAQLAQPQGDAGKLIQELHEAIRQYGVQCSETKELAPSRELAKALDAVANGLRAAQTAAQQDVVSVPKIWGVSRIIDNPKAHLVCFDSVPTDDELRAVQDLLAASQRKEG